MTADIPNFTLTKRAFGKPVWLHNSKPVWVAEYKPWGFLRQTDAESVMRVWVPFNYPKDGAGTPGAWWNEVPIGKLEPRRTPL